MRPVTLNAPFPYFGGKSRVAHLVWEAFGDVDCYVEPFFGSGAVLLGRPGGAGKVETVNDADGLLVNFWRAVRDDPAEVARHADWPVSEADLHPRHVTLVQQRGTLTEKLMGDPEFYDAKLAGWWVWGACCWIGSGWCSGEGPWTIADGRLVDQRETSQLPHLTTAGQGVNRKLPHLGDAGQGVNRQLPHLGDAGRVYGWFDRLARRLRNVRITCGDWTRVVTDSVTTRHGSTAVLLDPPYDEGAYTYGEVQGDTGLAQQVGEWAAANGNVMRIAYCGYEGGPGDLLGWRAVSWSGSGYGGGRDGEGDVNRHRERLWFSPACLDREPRLFGGVR